MVDNGTPAKRRKILLHALDKSPASTSGKSTVGDGDHEEIELPSDVAAAIAFLRQDCVNGQVAANIATNKSAAEALPKLLPPLVLMTQLYSIINDKRAVEMEVDGMRKRNEVRLLKLPTGPDEHGIMTNEDYRRFVLEAAIATSQTGIETAYRTDHNRFPDSSTTAGQDSSSSKILHLPQGDITPTIAIAHAFCDRVLPTNNEVSISKTLLLECLNKRCTNQGTAPACQPSRRGAQNGTYELSCIQRALPANKDEQLTLVLQLGVVSRHPMDDNMLLFCCPGMGPVIKSIMAGRKELLSLIAKKPHSEVPELTLLGRSLGRSIRNHTATGTAKLQEGGFLRDINFNFSPFTPSPARHTAEEEVAMRTPASQGLTRICQQSPQATVTPPSAIRLTKSGGVKLRQSVLGVAYHLRDMLGRGDLVRVYAPSGSFIRLSRHMADSTPSSRSKKR